MIEENRQRLGRFLLGFRRITSAGSYVPEVDGVRCLAILMVIAQHLHERVLRRYMGDHSLVENTFGHHLLSEGGKGVMIFFALSGYILYQLLSRPLLAGESLNWRAYFWRRITRLEPPYIVITTAIMAFVIIIGYDSGGKFLGKGGIPVWKSYLATITYTHTLIFGRAPIFNPPGWSLETEVQFYVLAPFLATGILLLRGAWSRLVLSCILTCSWSMVVEAIFSPHVVDRFSTSILREFPFFMVGVITCEFLRAVPRLPGWSSWLFDCLAFVAFLRLVDVLLLRLHVSFGMDEPLSLLLILLGAFRGRIIRSILSKPLVATIGGMCYTIYLVHLPVLELACGGTIRRLPRLEYWWLFAVEALICVPLVLLFSGIVFRLLEQPCMRKNWPSVLWARYRGHDSRSASMV